MRCFYITILLLLTLVVFGSATAAQAVEGSVELAFGYHDNVLESSDKKGSVFRAYQLDLYQCLYEGDELYVEGYGRGQYQDYTEYLDHYLLMLGGSVQQRLFNGAVYSFNYVEASRFHDALQREDERECLEAGWQLDHFLNERIQLTLLGFYRYSDYRQTYSRRGSQAGQPQVNSGGNGSSGSSPPLEQSVNAGKERVDRLWGVLTGFEYRWNADLFSGVKLFWNDNDSTVRAESYDDIGVELSCQWQLSPPANVELWGSWLEEHYRSSDDQQGLIAGRFNWQHDAQLCFYLQFEQLWHRSEIDEDDYNEKVSQCGIVWSF